MLKWLKSLFVVNTGEEKGADDASQAPQGEIKNEPETSNEVASEETSTEEVSPEASATPVEEATSGEGQEEIK